MDKKKLNWLVIAIMLFVGQTVFADTSSVFDGTWRATKQRDHYADEYLMKIISFEGVATALIKKVNLNNWKPDAYVGRIRGSRLDDSLSLLDLRKVRDNEIGWVFEYDEENDLLIGAWYTEDTEGDPFVFTRVEQE